MPRRTVENVIKAYFNGGRDDYFTSNRSLYIDGDDLMSYGSHFTLVRRYHDRKWPLYIINSSKSTKTTMGYASKCWQKIHWDKSNGFGATDDLGQKLTDLDLDGTKITDAGLKEVAKLQKLAYLDLQFTKITQAGVGGGGYGIDKKGLKWGETKFCTKGKYPDGPRASRDEAVKSFHKNLESLYRARASYRRQALVSIIGERVKSIRLLEEYFDLDTVELEIHKRMIGRLVKWRLEGEPIMGNWKSLMERLNGRREEQAAA